MTADAVAVGIDLGTSGADAVAIGGDGTTVARASSDYPLSTPHPGWSEQAPADWWVGACDALNAVAAALDGREIAAVGLTGQMHGMVPLARDGSVVRPAILWNDQRTAAQVERLEAAVGRDRLVARGGNPAITGFQLGKVLWLRDEEPAAFERTACVLFPKDWLGWRLTGRRVAEPCDASGSNAFALDAGDWDAEVLGAVDLDPTLWPPIVASDAVVGEVTAEAARATGLPAGTPVVAGGGDNACAATALGLGAHDLATGSLSLGTSGVLQVPLAHATPDPAGRVHLFAHTDGSYLMMGVTLSAAGSLRWLRDRLFPGRPFGDVAALAAGAPVGSGGVTFHPYLSGERTPYMDGRLRGSWQGLSLASDAPDLVRSVLEGVAFSLRDALEVIRPHSRPTRLLTTGGGARGDLWLQICADALGVPLVRLADAPGASHGAALVAWRGVGRRVAIAERVDRTVAPRGQEEEATAAAYARYRERAP